MSRLFATASRRSLTSRCVASFSSDRALFSQVSSRYSRSLQQVVVGDIALLEPGEVVPCDGIFLSGHNVKCDESGATGESDAIRKLPYADCIALRDKHFEESESISYRYSSAPIDHILLSRVLSGHHRRPGRNSRPHGLLRRLWQQGLGRCRQVRCRRRRSEELQRSHHDGCVHPFVPKKPSNLISLSASSSASLGRREHAAAAEAQQPGRADRVHRWRRWSSAVRSAFDQVLRAAGREQSAADVQSERHTIRPDPHYFGHTRRRCGTVKNKRVCLRVRFGAARKVT